MGLAYRITYHWDKEKKLTRYDKFPLWSFLGMFSVAVTIAIRLLIPESDAVFRQLLHPLTDGQTTDAFVEMMVSVKEGIPVGEAVAAFCSEILNHAY